MLSPLQDILQSLMILKRQRRLAARQSVPLFAAVERATAESVGMRVSFGTIRKVLDEHSPVACLDNTCEKCRASAARVYAEAARALGERA